MEARTRTQFDMWNPETWTDQDRQFIDAARKLTDDEKEFLIEFMQLLDGHPERAEISNKYMNRDSNKYNVKNPEGWAELLEILRAS